MSSANHTMSDKSSEENDGDIPITTAALLRVHSRIGWECIPNTLVRHVGRGRRDEVESAAHDILIKEFMRKLQGLLRQKHGAAVVCIEGGREPADVRSEESA
ncbi:hypothetical protein C8R44DRAFT_741141 [Mycena epipterygia]|nr:hypothetical protein C8R44DRAFT_741141 [Mycena epipterygia]